MRICTTLFRMGGTWHLKDYPKTRASEQTMPLPRNVVDSLRRHKAKQAAERLHAGEMWADEFGLVFTREDGGPLWHSTVIKHMKWVCRRIKIPELTLHELRHSTPSMLLSLGVDQRVIMRVLRHTTITLSANLYTHLVGPACAGCLGWPG